MKAVLSFVPPGGGEQDFMLEIELPGVPRVGDYIVIETDREDDSEGFYQGFIVRRNWWRIRDGALHRLVVEAEFAKTSWPTKAHTASLEMYSKRGHQPQDMQSSGY
mgnify:FL=1